MCSINEVFKTCPKCGCLVIWCNGGDVIYDSAQFMATCPSCGYKDHEAKFQRDKGLYISFVTEQQEKSYQEIKNLKIELEGLLKILVDDKEIEKPKRKSFLKGFIDRLWG
jgi:hypothetical protein